MAAVSGSMALEGTKRAEATAQSVRREETGIVKLSF